MANPYPLRLPDDLRRLLKQEAAKRGQSLAQVVISACWHELERTSGGTVDAGDLKSSSLGSGGSIPSSSTKPNMAAPLDICAGKGGALSMQYAINDCLEPCTHIEYVDTEGEWYRCSLIAGHKGKCVRGERV